MVRDTGEPEDEANAFVTGRRMRFKAGEENGEEGESGPSTVIPVVFGESGEAMMGAGNVCRFSEGGVLWCSVKSPLRSGVYAVDSGYRVDLSGVRGAEITSSALSNFAGAGGGALVVELPPDW